MAYRDTRDPRIELLAAQIAEEPELRARLVSTRREHAALEERAERLAREHAAATRGGLLAGVTGWFKSRSSAEDAARLEGELAAATAQLAELAAADRELAGRIAKLRDARRELADLVAKSVVALRAAPGPLGDELRALDAALASATERLAAVDTVLIACDRAHVAVAKLSNGEAARREHDSPIARAALTVAAAAAGAVVVPTNVDAHNREHAALDEWTRSHLPLAAEHLAALVPALDELRRRFDLWPGDPSLARACAQLAEPTDESILALALTPTLASLEQISSALATERTAIMRRRDELTARTEKLIR